MKVRQQFSKDDRNSLTKRQGQILQLLARGLTDKEMADSLGISEETVACHLRVMYGHKAVHCRAALVARLARLALMSERAQDP